jgi:hypothetical protein
MAAPSRSRNYRRGVAIDFDLDEYYAVLRALKDLPKEANTQLRGDARVIADTIIKPIVIGEILRHAPTVGPLLAQSVRVGRDRVPKVYVGYAKGPFYGGHRNRKWRSKGWADLNPEGPRRKPRSERRTTTFNRAASTNMLRYGTIVGVYNPQNSDNTKGRYRNRTTSVTWPKNVVKPGWTRAASDKYMAPTFAAWESSVQEICQEWLRGKYGR